MRTRFRTIVATLALLIASAPVANAAPRADKAHVDRWYISLKHLRNDAAAIVARAPRSEDDASLLAWGASDFYLRERSYERAVMGLRPGDSTFADVAASLQDVDTFLIGAVQNAMECDVGSGRANLRVVDAYIQHIERLLARHADSGWEPPNVITGADSAYRCRP
jgi:hypothetical protein